MIWVVRFMLIAALVAALLIFAGVYWWGLDCDLWACFSTHDPLDFFPA